jgi:hypothetical protein
MLEFSSAALNGQLRIAPKALLLGLVSSCSKPFRMIFLHFCENKSFAVIFLRKMTIRPGSSSRANIVSEGTLSLGEEVIQTAHLRNRVGVQYLTQNFKFVRRIKSQIKPERKLRRISTYEMQDLKYV